MKKQAARSAKASAPTPVVTRINTLSPITKPPEALGIEAVGKLFVATLEQVTAALQAAKDVELPDAVHFTKNLVDVADVLDKMMKNRVIEFTLAHGEQTTDKGGREAAVGTGVLCIRPWRTGVDAKKLESMLRRKGLVPEVAMVAKVSYGYDEKLTLDAVAKGRITMEEVESCYYDEKWCVMDSKGNE